MKVKEQELTIIQINDEDYICITDLARYKNTMHTDDVIKKLVKKQKHNRTFRNMGVFVQSEF